jgi:hypothetical protein
MDGGVDGLAVRRLSSTSSPGSWVLDQVAEASRAAPYSGGVVDRGRDWPKEVAARAGHTSVSFTLDRYGHLNPEADLALRDRLDAFHEAAGDAEELGCGPGPWTRDSESADGWMAATL